MAEKTYGGFWIRLLAYLVDSVILFTILWLLALAGVLLGPEWLYVVMILCVAGPVLYWALMQASARQATFGKALLGMKVMDADGERLSILRSLARELAKYVSAIPLMIGFLLAAFTSRKQALHDMIASTTVVRESPGHLLVGLVVGVFGWLAPVMLVMFVGGGVLALMMGTMGGSMLNQAMRESHKQPMRQTAMQRVPAAKPAATRAPAQPPVELSLAGDLDKALAARLSGLDKPGTAAAGPAVLALDKDFLFGSDFAIKVYLPPFREFQGGSAIVKINRVLDPKGADIYDAANTFEKDPFFQRASLSAAATPAAHLEGTRRVRLKSGANARDFDRADGTLNLDIAVNPLPAAFQLSEVGKAKTVHGVEIVLSAASGQDVSFELKGDTRRALVPTAFAADQRPLQPRTTQRSGAAVTYTFSEAPVRIELPVAQSLAQREFPFTLTRTSSAAAAMEVASAVPQPVATPSAAPTPAPAAKAAAAPSAAPPELAERPVPPAARVRQASVEPLKASAPKNAPVVAPAPQLRIVAEPKYNDLMTAVMVADPAAVRELLAMGKWPDKPDSHGTTPLMAAAMRGDQMSAQLLLKAGADPYRALAVARQRGDAAMTELLERYRK